MIDTLIGFGLGFFFGGITGVILVCIVLMAGSYNHEQQK